MIKKIKTFNKKGDLPVTLLVIGIFALCGFALLTFFISDFRAGNSFVGISILQKVNSNADEYSFYKNNGMKEDKLKTFFNITEEYGRNYFYEEKFETKGGVLFFGGKKVLLFSVQYQVPS
ncbi:hypothetical protein GW931_01540 [archaeon]|nr:hypothetical protein [archaeon]PJC45479.1 MAG: hypothetical protein CO037_01315 [Candidatus Pacearchaeota archaeon CG_4_9_14_0_2_um_filter_30_8]